MYLNKKRKYIVSSLLIVSLLSFGFSSISYASVQDAQDNLNKINEQIKDNNQKISSAEEQTNEYMEQISKLDEEIDKYSSDLEELNTKLNEVNAKVETYQNDLQYSSQRYSSAEDMYTTRLRAIYENGMPSMLDILFSSNGISDFFSKLNVYQSILDYDKAMVGNIKSEKEYVDNIKNEIKEQEVALENIKYDIEKSTQELESAKAEKNTKVQKLNEETEELKDIKATLKKRQAEATKQVQDEIAKAEAAANTKPGSAGYPVNFNGVLKWPTVSRVITCDYRGYVGHTGVDIKANKSPVYASADGLVIVAKTVTNLPNYSEANKHSFGYGNYIIIAHGSLNGKKMYTLYGHLTSLNVKVGQAVTTGQTIGISGNTGNSYGPHLHFEVRTNSGNYGSDVNPLLYLQ